MRVIAEFYKRLSPLQRSFLGALFGFAFYGAWAVLVNLMHGKESALKAGLVQGLYSFILTFFMTLLLETFYHQLRRMVRTEGSAICLTVFVSCSLVFTGSWYVNYISGTPEIFNTVILGYILGGVYSVVYTLGLARQARVTHP